MHAWTECWGLAGPVPALLVSLESSQPLGTPEQPSAPAAAALAPPASQQHQAEDAEAVANSPSMTTAVMPALTCAEVECATPAPAPSTAPANFAVSASLSHQDANVDDCVTLDNARSQQWRAQANAEPAPTAQGGSTAATSPSKEAQLMRNSELLPVAHSTALGSPAVAQHTPVVGSDVSGAQASGPHVQVQQNGRSPVSVRPAVGAPKQLPEPRRTPTSAHSAPSAEQPQPVPLSSVPDEAPQQHGIVMGARPKEPGVMGCEHAALGPVSPADERASDKAPPTVPAQLLLEVASNEGAASSMHGGCGHDVEAPSGMMHVAAGAGKTRNSSDLAASGAEADEREQDSGVLAYHLTVAAPSKARGGGTLGSLAGYMAVMALLQETWLLCCSSYCLPALKCIRFGS